MRTTPLSFARELRITLTEAERRLWNSLRNRSLSGHKFVRQAPIGPFIADFLCRERRLVVEVDGATHSQDSEISADARRTGYMKSEGYVVMRVWNIDVFTNLDGVLETIARELEKRESVFEKRRTALTRSLPRASLSLKGEG